MFHKKNNLENGFTILELTITILVISIGLTAVYGFFNGIISNTNPAVSKLKAAYLAQEGVEIVKNIRDANILQGLNWNNNLEDGDYEAAFNSASLTKDSSRFLKINSDGFYNYDTGNETKFKRKISLSTNLDSYGYLYSKVTVNVWWLDKRKEYRINVIDYIYDL